MAELYKKIRPKQGDRWDGLAYEWLGDASMVSVLMQENPHLIDKVQFDGNEVVFIPILEEEPQAQTNKSKAPWKK